GGMVVVNVTDDIPMLADVQPLAITVDEDDILTPGVTPTPAVNPGSTGTSPNDHDTFDGSFTGPEGGGGSGPANATSSGNLASLMASGADENLTFGFIDTAAMRAYLEGLGLESQGLPLGFDLSVPGTVTGFVNAQGGGQAIPGQIYDAGVDRLVFE